MLSRLSFLNIFLMPPRLQGYRVLGTLFLLVLFSFCPGVPFYLHRYLQKRRVYQAFQSGKFLARLSHASDKHRHFRCMTLADIITCMITIPQLPSWVRRHRCVGLKIGRGPALRIRDSHVTTKYSVSNPQNPQTVTESTIKVSRAHIMVLYGPILIAP
jgi:hypothetical protein